MCVHVGGIGTGRCPFFSRLNSVPAFDRSDRMCVRLPIVPAGRTKRSHLGPALAEVGALPSTNNMVEGEVNSQLGAVLRNRRGLTSAKRAKAVFRWRHAHSGDTRTEGRSGATGPCGRTSTTGAHTRSDWINGWKRMFYRDIHFVL